MRTRTYLQDDIAKRCKTIKTNDARLEPKRRMGGEARGAGKVA